MTIQSHWQLDVTAEPDRAEPAARVHHPSPVARDVRTPRLSRYGYYAQVGAAVAQTGFDGLFIPHREEGDDSRIVAAAIAREVPAIRLIPEFPASVGSAVYAAKQAVSFQRQAHGRLDWAIARDEDAVTRARRADFVAAEDLAARTGEFLRVARGVHGERPFSFEGRHFEVRDGGFEAPLNLVAFPRLFLQGETEEALALSARAADVHLFRAAPAEALRGPIETLDRQARAAGRPVAYGVIQPVLARESGDEAAEAAARVAAPDGAIVGAYHEVAAGLATLAALGISHFVLTARPSIEEAYRIGQHVLPRFRALVRQARAA